MQARIEPEMTMAELGVDSLDRMALLTTLMDLTGRYIPDTAVTDAQTLGDIVASLAFVCEEDRAGGLVVPERTPAHSLSED
jgi:acyl carrier protein